MNNFMSVLISTMKKYRVSYEHRRGNSGLVYKDGDALAEPESLVGM
jgi:hypothetical protein